ncbi:TolC family protein [Desulfoluna spongiiphila]|uniref:Outer membrane protein TolC n=1 Tax=Desulfoluna spongiiphila TaxID=419481 RepID=A0A1G5AFC3_9BACT|nr:TolC family protein [Desulfoluna spongiiphila]SCX76565.1 Outer membrane protein TolC [Desulfoluna spongiiphila]
MKRNILIVLMLLVWGIPQAGWTSSGRHLTLGLIADDTRGDMAQFLGLVHQEMDLLAGARYTYTLGEGKGGAIDWNADKARALYRELVADPEVDIIVSIGVVSSSVIADSGPYSKPVIAVGIMDSVLQGVRHSDEDRSGIANLTYVHFNHSITKDLLLFRRLTPFKEVGIVFDPSVADVIRKKEGELDKALHPEADYRIVSSNKGVNEVLAELSGVDAVYVGYLGAQEEVGRPALVQALTEMKIPTFGGSLRDVRKGVLASASPEGTFNRVARRVALNIDGWVGGDKLSDLPVNMEFEVALTINMETARAIGFSPSFEMLSGAQLLGDLQEGGLFYTLQDAVNSALAANYDLRINTFDVRQAKEAVRQAGTSFLPDVKLVGSQTFIDEDVATTSNNTQAERTTTGSAVVEQLIYSDEAIGTISSQKDLLEAEQESRQALILDTVFDTTVAFTDLLKARTEETVQMDNLALIRKNLVIAKQREEAGYAGSGDVFSWESRMATSKAALFTARSNVNVASRNLNLIMGVPIDQKTRALGAGLDDFMDGSFLVRSVKGRLTNTEGFETYLTFLVEEAVKNAPELSALSRNISAVETRAGVLSRKNWVPTVSAAGTWNRDMDRGGAGSEDGPLYHEERWDASVNLTWTLYSGGENRVELARERLTLAQLEEKRRKAQQEIELSVRVALLDTITRYVTREQAVRSAEYAKKSLNLIADSYAKGKASLTDLVEAQNSSLTADLEATNAIYEQVRALLKLERTVGKMTLVSDPLETEAFAGRIKALFDQ